MTICRKYSQGVDEFVSSSEQIWRNVALHHLIDPMDALQWMGAVRMRVQTADKNITIIHTSPSVNVLWSEKLCVCKKQIHI